MNDFRNIFSVSKEEYQSFVEQIKPEYRKVEIIDLSNYIKATKIFSKKTNKCLCSRVTYEERVEGEERNPEIYYIFEMPDDDERRAPIPKRKIYLNSKEEVQAFVNLVSKLQKEQKT